VWGVGCLGAGYDAGGFHAAVACSMCYIAMQVLLSSCALTCLACCVSIHVSHKSVSSPAASPLQEAAHTLLHAC
jgi:hypothetical protein